MNTYLQDTEVPIYIFLQFSTFVMKFPINPEQIRVEIPSESETDEVEGVGEISTLTPNKLAKIQIDSFFWSQNNLVPSALYVNWLKLWQKSKLPARLIVTRLNYNYLVSCENFSYWINAGEEKDTYFSLTLKEYKIHKAKKVSLVTSNKIINGIKAIMGYGTSPILTEIPRPARDSTLKEVYKSPYTVSKNETVMSITKKITGDSSRWNELYSLNVKVIGDSTDGTIAEGTKLVLPTSWTNKDENVLMENTGE